MYKFVSLLILATVCSAVPFRGSDGSNRISNGQYASNVQFPYAVSIQHTTNNQAVATRGHKCGGVLVRLNAVVTTASCMYEYNIYGIRELIIPAYYRVFAGAHLLSNDTSPDHFRSFQYILHPYYYGYPSHVNDIAIVYLTSPFSDTIVTPLSIPPSDYNPADFTDCTVVGWGAPIYGAPVTANVELKYVNTYIYNQQACTTVYNPQIGRPNILPSMICAASYDIVSSGCNGDEGNALVCGNTLTGILSLHGNCGASSYPEIYTRISSYSDWLTFSMPDFMASSATSITSGVTIILLLAAQMTFARYFS